jgi:iron(III) transport system substrate-binding protein
MDMKKVILVLLSMLFVLSGCGGQKNNGAQNNAGKSLVVVSSWGHKKTLPLVQAFADKTGITVQVEELSAEPLSLRLQYLENQHFDMWLGGTAEEYYRADCKHLLQSYQSPLAATLPAEILDKNGRWTPLAVDYVALVINKNRIRKLHLPMPSTLEDLTQPVFHHDIVMMKPENGGASFAMITAAWQWFGKTKALEIAGKLRTQEPEYVQTDAEAALRVYKGEKAVAILPLTYALQLQKEHYELSAVALQDCNQALVTGGAILKNGANQESAKQFLDFTLGTEGMQILNQSGLLKPGRLLKDNGEIVPLAHADLAWTGGTKQEIISNWLTAY